MSSGSSVKDNETPILEVCCADVRSLYAAVEGGAHRVELCAALGLDGLTPSMGFIETALECGIVINVLIRPREGDFVYSDVETDCMIRDIKAAKMAGANGVVIGALTPDGRIDMKTCLRLAEAAEGMEITFHRAFDVCVDPFAALDAIYGMGCRRLLTSGQAATAYQGIPMIKSLVERAWALKEKYGHTFHIMPGCGVTADNAQEILQKTGAVEIHGSLRKNGHTDPHIVRRVAESIIRRQSSSADVSPS